MSHIVGVGKDNKAILYGNAQCAIEDQIPYAEFEAIPEGSGIMKTDLRTIWFEAIQEDVPKPTVETLQIENAILTEKLELMDSAMMELVMNVIPSLTT